MSWLIVLKIPGQSSQIASARPFLTIQTAKGQVWGKIPHFDYHQGHIQAYFESVEPSDYRLYVSKKKLLKIFIKKLFFHND